MSVAQLLPSATFEGRAELEQRMPITISASELGGRSFVVHGRKNALLQVRSVSCGTYHTAACTNDGQLYAWGANGDGQLGVDDFKARPALAPVPVLAAAAAPAPTPIHAQPAPHHLVRATPSPNESR